MTTGFYNMWHLRINYEMHFYEIYFGKLPLTFKSNESVI